MRLLLFIFALAFSNIGTAKVNLDFTDGAKSQLSKEQVQELISRKAAIGVPTYIPIGFKLNKCTSNEASTKNYIAVEYALTYQNSKGKKFIFQASNDGIGDALINNEIMTTNPVLEGKVYIGHYDDKSVTATQWIKAKKQFQPTDVENSIHYSLIAENNSLSILEIKKIMESLRILKK